MTSISAISSSNYQSPLQKLQDELQAEINSGTIGSSDQDALSSALTDIDSSLQSSRASDSAGGTRPSPGDLKSKIDDLIAGEVSSGKLTSDQATELQGVFKAAFANGPGGAGGPDGAGGAHGHHGSHDGPPPTDGDSSSDSASSSSGASSADDILQQFLQSLQQQLSASSSSFPERERMTAPSVLRLRGSWAAICPSFGRFSFALREPIRRYSVDSVHQPREGAMTDVMTKPHHLIASDRVEGTAVRRPNGDKIGHIERLMIDKVSGKVSYAILSFGGFLGMGTSLLPLPWARLTYNTRFEAYQLDIDDDELKRAPSFRADKDFDWGDRSQETELHRYYGTPPYWGGF